MPIKQIKKYKPIKEEHNMRLFGKKEKILLSEYQKAFYLHRCDSLFSS